MTNNEFCAELHNIVTLLNEHREWQYLQPEKYNSVKLTVSNDFINLIERKTGIKSGLKNTEVAVDDLKSAVVSEAKKIVSKIKRKYQLQLQKNETISEQIKLKEKINRLMLIEQKLK